MPKTRKSLKETERNLILTPEKNNNRNEITIEEIVPLESTELTLTSNSSPSLSSSCFVSLQDHEVKNKEESNISNYHPENAADKYIENCHKFGTPIDPGVLISLRTRYRNNHSHTLLLILLHISTLTNIIF